MKQRLFIILALFFLLTLLIGLNAVSYTQKEKVPDTEEQPNRSTYNAGATGTRAFYDLLAETGKKVKRWQEPFPTSGKFDENQFSIFVIIGQTRRGFEENELRHITNWVSNGGTLVVIDRRPPNEFLETTSDWSVRIGTTKNFALGVNPSDQTQMTAETDAVRPAQPTVLTNQINAVQSSKFASSIYIARPFDDKEKLKAVPQTETDQGDLPRVNIFQEPQLPPPPPPPPPAEDNEGTGQGSGSGDGLNENEDTFKTPEATPMQPMVTPSPHIKAEEKIDVSVIAPVIHLGNEKQNLLADFPLGAGKIIFLSDPYIVSNGGINLVDNAALATNIVGARQGFIAFDEYHQGYGRNNNMLFEYLAGTPVVPIFLQIFLIVGLIFYTQSRRFARALPADEPNRLSKLEYVSAMAQLQGRTKAFDLAIENIYKEFRRRVTRLIGIDNHTAKVEDIAEKIAERTEYKKEEVADLMLKCEGIMHGDKTNKNEIVRLTSRLREIENALGLRRGKVRNS